VACSISKANNTKEYVMKRIRKNIVLLTIILSLIFTTSLTTFCSTTYLPLETNTIVSKWLARNIIQGDSNGNLRLSDAMTRAEFAIVLCRVFGFSDIKNSVVLSDVPDEKWYSSSIQKVLSKGLMNFDSLKSTSVFHPTSFITSQEAIDSLLKTYKLTLFDCFKSNMLHSNSPLTRLDCIMLIDNLTKEIINNACLYASDIDGNLIINTSNVTLKDMTIAGNLYLTEGIGDGCVTLDNVHVKGVVYVNGCGENSLLIKNKSSINSMIVENKISTVRVSTDSTNTIQKLVLLSPTILDESIVVSDFESNKYAIYISHNTSFTPINNSTSNIDRPTPNIHPAEEPNNNFPANNTPPPIEPGGDLPPIVTPTPADPGGNDIPPIITPAPVDPNVGNPTTTTGSSIHLDSPSNICIDFDSYPYLAVSCDEVPLALSYTFSITNLQNTTLSSSSQTTSSIISLDTSTCPIIPNNDYAISITAISDSDSSTTTKILKIPNFSLHELNNGTLNVKVSEHLMDTIMLKNFNLCIYKETTDSNGMTRYIPEDVFELKNNITSYAVPIKLVNDVTYSLKILNTSLLADNEPIISGYTANYFANVSYQQASEMNSIQLTTARHLRNLSDFVNTGQSTENKYFKLLNDIDFSNPMSGNNPQAANNFTPIGVLVDDPALANSKNSRNNKAFKGDFDGGDHHILNLNIDAATSNNSSPTALMYVGLFAFTTGNIKNITLDNSCKIKGDSRNTASAGIVAYADYSHSSHTISGCYNYASIHGLYHASGIVGILYTNSSSSAMVENCYNYGEINSSNNSSGIISESKVAGSSCIDVTNCYNFGIIKGKFLAGGIIGSSRLTGTSTLQYCYNFGTVSTEVQTASNNTTGSGGILGWGSNKINISYCLNGGNIIGYCDTTSIYSAHQSVLVYTGGIIGYLDSTSSHLFYDYNYGSALSSLSKTNRGIAYSGPILADPAACSDITYCYTISYANPVPDDAQQHILSLFYTEFIDKVKASLPAVSNAVESSIKSSLLLLVR